MTVENETIASVPATQPRPLPDDDVSTRYGRGSRTARTVVMVVLILLGTAALVWLGWVIWLQSTPDVESDMPGFKVVDAHTATATIHVELANPGVVANCLVQALGDDHSVVGERHFKVTETTQKMVHTISIRTERLATAVELVGCTSKDQKRPR